MNTAEYLDAAKAALNIESDYALAQRLSVTRTTISLYRSGKSWPDAYACIRLAIILKLDPAQVIADLERQHEKNPVRQEFWASFLSRAASVAAICCTLVLTSIGSTDEGWAVAGGSLAASVVFLFALAVAHNLTLCRQDYFA